DVMSTLLTRQTTESASTEIFVLGVKPNEVRLPNRRAMTACRKRALPANVGLSPRPRPRLGPASVTGKANAVCCTTMKANAGIVSFFICAASLFWRPRRSPRSQSPAAGPADKFFAKGGDFVLRHNCICAILRVAPAGLNRHRLSDRVSANPFGDIIAYPILGRATSSLLPNLTFSEATVVTPTSAVR